MEFEYKTYTLIITSVFVAISLYLFINDQDEDAILMVWLSLYVMISTYYVLKSLYYLKHSATFNEVIYVIILPIIPPFLLYFEKILELNPEVVINVNFVSDQIISSTITVLDFLFIPYYLATIFLILRTRLRYPFIRLQGHSDGGIPTTIISLLQTVIIPFLYFTIGWIIGSLILIQVSVFIAVISLLGFII